MPTTRLRAGVGLTFPSGTGGPKFSRPTADAVGAAFRRPVDQEGHPSFGRIDDGADEGVGLTLGRPVARDLEQAGVSRHGNRRPRAQVVQLLRTRSASGRDRYARRAARRTLSLRNRRADSRGQARELVGRGRVERAQQHAGPRSIRRVLHSGVDERQTRTQHGEARGNPPSPPDEPDVVPDVSGKSRSAASRAARSPLS